MLRDEQIQGDHPWYAEPCSNRKARMKSENRSIDMILGSGHNLTRQTEAVKKVSVEFRKAGGVSENQHISKSALRRLRCWTTTTGVCLTPGHIPL